MVLSWCMGFGRHLPSCAAASLSSLPRPESPCASAGSPCPLSSHPTLPFFWPRRGFEFLPCLYPRFLAQLLVPPSFFPSFGTTYELLFYPLLVLFFWRRRPGRFSPTLLCCGCFFNRFPPGWSVSGDGFFLPDGRRPCCPLGELARWRWDPSCACEAFSRSAGATPGPQPPTKACPPIAISLPNPQTILFFYLEGFY